LAKKHGVEKLLAVCPVENELFYTEDAKLPLQKQAEAQEQSLKVNQDLAILNTDLVYGRSAHLLKYVAQCAEAGRIYSNLGGALGHRFKPVAEQDLSAVVEHALTNFKAVKGQNYLVNGAEEATLNDLLHVLEAVVGKAEGSTKLSKSLLNVSDYVEEFFVGIAHDKNFRRLGEYFETYRPDLAEGRVNYHEKHGLARLSTGIRPTYQALKLREEDLVFPTFSDYKMVSLD
jgi:nucleoside-diphosphate-sugar epimerase